VLEKAKPFVRGGRKAAGLINAVKMAELPKVESSSAFFTRCRKERESYLKECKRKMHGGNVVGRTYKPKNINIIGRKMQS
jgi:hypothetical protein